jgi:hypothetical protein
MKLIPGSELTEAQRAAALNLYVHRHTVEHPFPEAYAPGRAPTPTMTDAEWLDARSFWINRSGTLSDRRECVPHHPATSAQTTGPTPGPWRTEIMDWPFPDQIDVRIVAPDGWVLAEVKRRGSQVAVRDANARLIAAAPDLLAFVRAFAEAPTEGEVPGRWGVEVMDKIVMHARALLARIDGQERS